MIDDARFPGRQGRLLFAYLAAEQGRPVPKDELAEAIWGETPPPSWDKALTGVVSKVRALLASSGIDGGSALTGAFGCYRLDLPAGTWVDVIAATDAVVEAEAALAAGDPHAARTAAAEAASLTRQAFLPGEDGSWVEEKRRELAEVRLRALSALADACLCAGDGQEATIWAEQAVRLAPFRESGYRRLMEAHIAAGNRAEALQTYERCRRLLAEEIGAYPSPEIESVYRRLLERPSDEAPVPLADQAPASASTDDEPAAPARVSSAAHAKRRSIAAAAATRRMRRGGRDRIRGDPGRKLGGARRGELGRLRGRFRRSDRARGRSRRSADVGRGRCRIGVDDERDRGHRVADRPALENGATDDRRRCQPGGDRCRRRRRVGRKPRRRHGLLDQRSDERRRADDPRRRRADRRRLRLRLDLGHEHRRPDRDTHRRRHRRGREDDPCERGRSRHHRWRRLGVGDRRGHGQRARDRPDDEPGHLDGDRRVGPNRDRIRRRARSGSRTCSTTRSLASTRPPSARRRRFRCPAGPRRSPSPEARSG